jgi:hypothetical protein
MASRRQEPGKYLSSAVREALDSVVAPSVRDAVLGSAVDEHGGDVPSDPIEFERFLCGPLRRSLVRSLGDDVGEAVFEELERVSRSALSSMPPATAAHPPVSRRPGQSGAASGRRPSGGHRRTAPATGSNTGKRHSSAPPPAAARRPTPLHVPRGDAIPSGLSPTGGAPRVASSRPSPPSSNEFPLGTSEALALRGLVRAEAGTAPRHLPVILVCSADVQLPRRLACWVDEHVAVMRIANLMSLLYALDDAGPASKVVVVDCKTPSVRPHSVATLAEDLPALGQVVLWGAAPELARELAGISPRASIWRNCAANARDREIALHCARMIR